MYGTPDDPGIVPRIIEDLFAYIKAKKVGSLSNDPLPSQGINGITTVHFNYYEIYNERIYDLLQDKKNAPRVRCKPLIFVDIYSLKLE